MTMRAVIAAIAVLLTALPAYGAPWGLEEVLTAYLKSTYPWQEIVVSDAELQGEAPSTPPVRVRLERGQVPGKAVFVLDYKGGRRTATASIRAYDSVVMSRNALAKGAELNEDDLYVAAMDIVRIPRNAVRDPDRLVGKYLARSVLPNMVLSDDAVEDAPRVKAGQKVLLIVQSAGFTIRTSGQMKQSGAVGEYVKVLNPSSKKVLTGLLVDPETVKVNF
jgi:flagella basal body P-ring formation protein FlgA